MIQNSNKRVFQINHCAVIKFTKLSSLKYYFLIYNPYSSSASWLMLPFIPIFCFQNPIVNHIFQLLVRLLCSLSIWNSFSAFLCLSHWYALSSHLCKCVHDLILESSRIRAAMWPKMPYDTSGGTRCRPLIQEPCAEHVLGAELWSPQAESNHGLTGEEDRK